MKGAEMWMKLASHSRCEVCAAHGEVWTRWNAPIMRAEIVCEVCRGLCDELREEGKTLGNVTRWYAELGPGALSASDMARACGLHFAFYAHVCSLCGVQQPEESCYVELDQGNVGLVTRAVCVACLPGHFEKHMREQAAADALVEAVSHGGCLLTSAATDERRAA